MNKQISIIMPYLNESDMPNNTIESIYTTADSNKIKIIAIDDNSDDKNKTVLKDFPNVCSIKNDKRMGVDWCRQKGVELADTKEILVIDGHMVFRNDNWLEKMVLLISKEPKTIWCTTCLGLGYGANKIEEHKGKYYGADLRLLSDQEKDRPCRQILEPRWATEKSEKDYKIGCPLGANYFFNRDYFLNIHGLRGLRSWGSSEPFLGLKSYLAGGDCKITKEIEIGHFFRSEAPYVTGIKFLVYNKVFVLKTIFPKELEDKLMKYLPKDRNYNDAMQMIEADKALIEQEKQYYQSIFKCSVYDYCKRFNIEIPN